MFIRPKSEYRIPVVTYVKDENKRHFFFYYFSNIFIDAGWYSEQQSQLDAMKSILEIEQGLIIKGSINKDCPVCFEPLNVDLKNMVYIFKCKHTTHVSCTRKSEHMLHYKTCPLCRGTLERVHYLIVEKKIYEDVRQLFKKFNIGLKNQMFERLQNKRYIEVLLFRKEANKPLTLRKETNIKVSNSSKSDQSSLTQISNVNDCNSEHLE